MANVNYTLVKSKIDLYKIKGSNGSYADITIECGDGSGRIMIASDYGNWSYYWGACGSSFKEFLVGLELPYTATKFGEGHWLDIDATCEQYTQDCNNISMQGTTRRKSMLKEIKSLKDSSNDTEFELNLFRCKTIISYYDEIPPLIRRVSPSLKRFWETLWSVFIQKIKYELREEKE